MRIAIVSGSPRGNSVTFRIALHLVAAFRKACDHQIDLIDLKKTELPLLQSVFTSVEATPEAYREVAQQMFAADAYVMITPEYNGSYSAALKNLFDHFPKQHHKVFGIVTATTGALGGIRSAMQLQELVYALFGIGSPYMLVTPQVDKKFDSEGLLLDAAFGKNIDIFIREFLWLAEKITAVPVAS